MDFLGLKTLTLANVPIPILFNFHGGGGDPISYMNYTSDMRGLAWEGDSLVPSIFLERGLCGGAIIILVQRPSFWIITRRNFCIVEIQIIVYSSRCSSGFQHFGNNLKNKTISSGVYNGNKTNKDKNNNDNDFFEHNSLHYKIQFTKNYFKSMGLLIPATTRYL